MEKKKVRTIKIVTAADERYVPGVVALYNSIVRNFPSADFNCIVHDKKTLNILADIGIPVSLIATTELPDKLPGSIQWDANIQAMYSRLLIPHLYDEPYVLWLDADTLVLKEFSIPEIFEPCAGVVSWDYTIESQIPDLPFNTIKSLPALQAGVLLINCFAWKREKILEKCIKLMTLEVHYKYVVQSLLNLALEGHFARLPYSWNTFTNDSIITDQTIIAHYAGRNCLPWENKNIPYISLWEYYYG